MTSLTGSCYRLHNIHNLHNDLHNLSDDKYFRKSNHAVASIFNVKWSLPKIILCGTQSMLITWQVFFFRLVGKLLKTIISLDISGSRHGMKLKLSPKKLFGKRWPLVMSLRGSYDKRIFYRVKNKSWICDITEEVGMQ